MKNYDDLQRFKDKTRTDAINFKDMSAQHQQLANSHWAIIKQLATDDGDGNLLTQGGSISNPIPQVVDAGVFAINTPESEHNETSAPALTSLLFSQLAASLPVAEKAAAQAQKNVEPFAPHLSTPSKIFEKKDNVFFTPADNSAPPVHFARLFATKGAAPVTQSFKDIPLKTVLEAIALCR